MKEIQLYINFGGSSNDLYILHNEALLQQFLIAMRAERKPLFSYEDEKGRVFGVNTSQVKAFFYKSTREECEG